MDNVLPKKKWIDVVEPKDRKAPPKIKQESETCSCMGTCSCSASKKAAKQTFKVGDQVKLKPNALAMHSRSVPAHAGYTHEQFEWRDTLNKLGDSTGTIERVFENSSHVNVDFNGTLIGVESDYLDPIGAERSASVKCPECGKPVWDVATVDQALNKCWNCGARWMNDPDDEPEVEVSQRKAAQGTCKRCKKEGIINSSGAAAGLCDVCEDDLLRQTYGEREAAGDDKVAGLIKAIMDGTDPYYGYGHFDTSNMADYGLMSDTINEMVSVYGINEEQAAQIIEALTHDHMAYKMKKQKQPVTSRKIAGEFKKVATGEPDQDYDHELYDEITNALSAEGFRASHKEFDKYQGVYIKVDGDNVHEKFWTEDVFFTGEREGDPAATTFTYKPGTEAQHLILIPESQPDVKIQYDAGSGDVGDILAYLESKRPQKKGAALSRVALKLWEHPADYMGEDYPDYYVGPGQSRDSDALERSNFKSALEMLGGEKDGVIVARFNHWAVGWVESILVHKDAKEKVAILQDIENKMADYPVLDEDDYSETETEEYREDYDSWARQDALAMIKKHLNLPDYELSEKADEMLWRAVEDTFANHGEAYLDEKELLNNAEEVIETIKQETGGVAPEQPELPLEGLSRKKPGWTKTSKDWETCTNCGGDGHVEGKECPACEGTGRLPKTEASKRTARGEEKGQLILSYDQSDVADNQVKWLMEEPDEGNDYWMKDEVEEAWEKSGHDADKFKALLKQEGLEGEAEEQARNSAYEDSDIYQFAWDDLKDGLSEALAAKNPNNLPWRLDGSNLGWQARSGYMYVETNNGAEFLDKVLPKTDVTVEVYDEGDALHFKVYHHDAPTGEHYYARPEAPKEEEDIGAESSKRSRWTKTSGRDEGVADERGARNWHVRYYSIEGDLISEHNIENRDQHQAEHEAIADMPQNCEDWSMSPVRTKKAGMVKRMLIEAAEDIYYLHDQPMMCPKCGARTDFVEVPGAPVHTETHTCPECKYAFTAEAEPEDMKRCDDCGEELDIKSPAGALQYHYECPGCGKTYAQDVTAAKRKADFFDHGVADGNPDEILPVEDLLQTDEPTEPADDDIVITTEGRLGGMYAAYQSGKQIAKSVEWDEIMAAIKSHMDKEKFYPGVWLQDDHGGISPVDMTKTAGRDEEIVKRDVELEQAAIDEYRGQKEDASPKLKKVLDHTIEQEREHRNEFEQKKVMGADVSYQGLGAFVGSYLEAALWSSNDESDESGGDPLDQNYDFSDIAPDDIELAKADCAEFQKQAGDLLKDMSEEQAGHDFWLTRNGHGAGFWDRGLGEIGDKLTEIAHSFGEINIYVGDEGTLHFAGLQEGGMKKTAAEGIRPYGPGKFGTIVDQIAWELTMAGADEEVSNEGTSEWYGLLRDVTVEEAEKAAEELKVAPLTDAEKEWFRVHPFIIIGTGEQGFVAVNGFTNEVTASKLWDEIVFDMTPAEEDLGAEGAMGDKTKCKSCGKEFDSTGFVYCPECADVVKRQERSYTERVRDPQFEVDAGLSDQVKSLRRKLKDLDVEKADPSEIASTVDALEKMEKRLKDQQETRQTKKDERAKAVEEAATVTAGATEQVKPGGETREQKIQKVISDLSKDPDILEMVKTIESKMATTKGHYGDYMRVLDDYKKNRTMLNVMAQALIGAGANPEGVQAALGIMSGSAFGSVIEAGLSDQVKSLRKKLKELDVEKAEPSEIASTVDALEKLEKRLKEQQETRKQNKEEKAQAAEEAAKTEVTAAEFGSHGLGHGLDDLYVLPSSPEEADKIIAFLENEGMGFQWSNADVEGHEWYGKRFIEIPFGDAYKGEIEALLSGGEVKASLEIQAATNEQVISMFAADSFPKDKMPTWGTQNLKINKEPNGWSLINYATPIAYRSNEGQTFINTQKYSQTTSKIQSVLKRYMGAAAEVDEAGMKAAMQQTAAVESVDDGDKGLHGESSLDKQADGENGYIGYYRGKQYETHAKTSYEAQQKIAKEHGIKKAYEITVVLAEKGGEEVTHKPQDIVGSMSKKADELDYETVMNMNKEQLMALPTIHSGHFDNVKFDDGKHRVSVSRMTVADGAAEDNEVSFEVLTPQGWITAGLKKRAGLEPGTKVKVTPTAPGLVESYPAAKWLTQDAEVTLVDYAPNEGTLDVIDVMLPSGQVESIYDFNIIEPEREFNERFEEEAAQKCADTSGTGHAGPIVAYYSGSNTPTYYCDKHVPMEMKKDAKYFEQFKSSDLAGSAWELDAESRKLKRKKMALKIQSTEEFFKSGGYKFNEGDLVWLTSGDKAKVLKRHAADVSADKEYDAVTLDGYDQPTGLAFTVAEKDLELA